MINQLFTRRNLGIAGLAALAFLVFLAALNFGLGEFNRRRGEQQVENLKKALEKIEEDAYQKMMADTYGGKTPEETLQMYIDAVEKGDYELASRYFIISGQEKEKKELIALQKKNNIKEYLSFIKKAEPWRSSLEDENFVMTAKSNSGPSIFINFTKYPNGVWKIIEI